MHISNSLEKTKQKKNIAKQPKLLGKVCFLCCVIVCGCRHNEECRVIKNSASLTNVWPYDFCLIVSLLFHCIVISFMQLMKGSLTVWALYAYFSDSQNAAFELLVWCM